MAHKNLNVFINRSKNSILHPVTPGRIKVLKLLYPNEYTRVFSRSYTGKYEAIERLDQGHLYPLGERRDKHVMGGAGTSCTAGGRFT
jgi:hypothetical protein